MTKNLVVLSKYEDKKNILPSEQIVLCATHYETEKQKRDFKDFQVNEVESSMPKTWCELCSPPDWGY